MKVGRAFCHQIVFGAANLRTSCSRRIAREVQLVWCDANFMALFSRPEEQRHGHVWAHWPSAARQDSVEPVRARSQVVVVIEQDEAHEQQRHAHRLWS